LINIRETWPDGGDNGQDQCKRRTLKTQNRKGHVVAKERSIAPSLDRKSKRTMWKLRGRIVEGALGEKGEEKRRHPANDNEL